MDSPYTLTPRVPSQTDRSATIMHDTTSGDALVVQSEEHTVTVDPVTLDQTTLHQKVHVWSVLGAPIIGSVTYRCNACRRYPFVENETTHCPCGKTVCKNRCTRHEQCRRCSWITTIREFVQWLLRL